MMTNYVTATDTNMCSNAFHGIEYWFCHHYGGRIIEGTEITDNRALCEACEKARPGYDEPPSFLQHQEQ